MRATELIAELQKIIGETKTDPDVLAQSSGCCYHGHEINSVEMGSETYKDVSTKSEIGSVIIRVG